MEIEARLKARGLVLPEALKVSPTTEVLFVPVRLIGSRAYISGHVPQAPDGSIAEPRGKVGQELSPDEGRHAAELVALSVLASLKRELGDLDRVKAWLRVFGMVNSAPGFTQQSYVVNGFSKLILDLYGPSVGQHVRSAVGMAELPFNVPVEVEAEVKVA